MLSLPGVHSLCMDAGEALYWQHHSLPAPHFHALLFLQTFSQALRVTLTALCLPAA